MIRTQLTGRELESVIHRSLTQVELTLSKARQGHVASMWELSRLHPTMIANLVSLLRTQLCATEMLREQNDRLRAENTQYRDDYFRRTKPLI